MATIKEIAKLANVSMATVSRVLNKDEQIQVTDHVRNQIFTIAHELGYVPPKQRHIPVNSGITIGVADWHIIRSERTNQKLSDLSNMAKRYCVTPVHFVQVSFRENVKVDGIIALGHFSEEEVEFLNRQSCFLLFVDSNQYGYQYDRIIIDHNVGVKDFLHYMIHEKKHHTFGYIGGCYSNGTIVIGRTRSNEFEALLKEAGYYDENSFLVGNMTKESGAAMANRLISENHLPDVLLIGNDELAEGVINEFEQMNIIIPQDVTLVIYKDIETSISIKETLPSIRVYTDFMWKYAIKLLLERISGERVETLTLTFPSKFIQDQI